MAIFAKKKDKRRNQDATGTEGTRDSVALEFPGSVTVGSEASPASAASAVSKAASTNKGADASTDAAGNYTAREAATGATAAANDTGAAASTQADARSAAGASNGIDVTLAATAAAGQTRAPDAATMTDGVAPHSDPMENVDIEPEEMALAPSPSFGIEDAIRLMRSLPADPNIDLVVRVVRVTLSAVNVSVEEIMQDAERKEKKVRESISMLETEVSSLEEQLQARRSAIAAHQADLRETATVRERLNMADKYTPHPPPPPPGATRVPLPKPREWERFDGDTPFKNS